MGSVFLTGGAKPLYLAELAKQRRLHRPTQFREVHDLAAVCSSAEGNEDTPITGGHIDRSEKTELVTRTGVRRRSRVEFYPFPRSMNSTQFRGISFNDQECSTEARNSVRENGRGRSVGSAHPTEVQRASALASVRLDDYHHPR